ncbi:MAG: hypothetical protein NTY68_02705 [Candidatus Micrarchaeota archaeon]|nr:hypothetical protein [Candidatus Micrarchaeota archaeon]
MGDARVCHAFADIKRKLSENGFNEADKSKIYTMALKYKRTLDLGVDFETFSIFNRGLDNKKSNFFVFLGMKKGFFNDKLKVLYYNPAPPNVRFNFREDYQAEQKRGDTIISREYDGKNGLDEFVSRTLYGILKISSSKPENRYYYWPHNHAGYLEHNGKIHRLIDIKPGEIPSILGPVDDGKSNPFDMMISAALFNGDFFAITSHNSFSYSVFNELNFFGKSLGISVVPGIEFTMPISSYNPEDVAILFSNMNEKLNEHGLSQLEIRKGSVTYSTSEIDSLLHWYKRTFGSIDFDVPLRAINGPHIIAMFNDPKLAERVNSLMLSSKDVQFPPFSAPGIELFRTLTSLRQNYRDRVFIMVAHPFCDLKLPSVGIGNRMATGDLSWPDSLSLFRNNLADGIAAYNPSVKPEWNNFNELDFSLLDSYPRKYHQLLRSWIEHRNLKLTESSQWINGLSQQKWGFQTLNSDALNMAYAKWISHWGVPFQSIVRMGEPDTHFFGKFDFDDVHANHLMRVVSYVDGENIEKTPKGLLEALFMAKRHQEGINANYYAYAEMDQRKRHLVFEESREPTQEESREEQLKYITNYGMGFFNVILPDFVKRAFLRTGLPFSKTLYLLNKFIKE